MVVMDRRRFLKIAVAAGAVGGAGTLLDACNASVQAGGRGVPAAGGTLFRLSDSLAESFDPASSQNMPISELGWVHRRLTGWHVAPGADVQLVPDMATGTGRPGDGGWTWTYTLKNGLAFSDGSPVTSADVKWSLERSFAAAFAGGLTYHQSLLVGGLDYRGPFGGQDLPSIETPDQKTIVFHLVRPYGDWPWISSTPAFAAVPKGKGANPDYGDHPFATGPYQVASFQQGVRVTLARNPHWARATDQIRPALPDQIVIELALDDTVIAQRLIADNGSDRYAFGAMVSPAELADVVGNPSAKPRLVTSPGGALDYLVLNTQKAPLNDPAVRRAFQYAVDKRAFQVAMAGSPGLAGPLATTLITPGIAGRQVFDLYPAPPGGDPARARQMLAAAGYSGGLRNLVFLTYETQASYVQALTYALGQAGIQVSVQYAPDFAPDGSNYDMGVGGWQPDFPSPNANIEPLFASYNINGNNLSRYDNPEVDRMIARAQAILDPVAAAPAWTAIDRRIMSDSPVVPLIYARSGWMHGSGVGDFFIGAFGAVPDYLKMGIIR
jgi:peptide/nickel transport system substrate-binding protein